jgi:hypothetical protein
MSRGGWSVFTALILSFLVALLVISGLRYAVEYFFPNSYVQDKSTAILIWEVLDQLVGLNGANEDANIYARVVGILGVFAGFVLFSSLVAFIAQELEAKVHELQKGKSLVVEKNHTIILGFGDRTLDILQELLIANESESDAAIVILANFEKEDMDDTIRARLPETGHTRVVTRTGRITSISNLRKVRVDVARSIIILNEAIGSDPDSHKILCDSRVIKAILAILATIQGTKIPPIIVELHSKQYRRLAQNLAPDAITPLNESEILGRLVVQTSRSIGLATLYLNLVGFEGHEFYFYRPKAGWKGLPFGKLPYYFSGAVPIGVRDKNNKITINPLSRYQLEDSDDVVVLAEDDSTIQFHGKPVHLPRALSRGYVIPVQPKQVEFHLILGWNDKTAIALMEYGKSVGQGSKLHVVVNEIKPEMQRICDQVQVSYPQLAIEIQAINLNDPVELKTLNLEQFNTIIILAENGEDIEAIDSKTLTLLLEVRQLVLSQSQAVKTDIIAEIANSEDTDLVIRAGVKDFVLSNKLVSKVLAQVSQEPEIMQVYQALFTSDGSEFYLKPVSYFLPKHRIHEATFADCILAAQMRSELCVGVKISAYDRDIYQNFGVRLVPELSACLELTEADYLITLAEDET